MVLFCKLPDELRNNLLVKARGKSVALPESSDPRVQSAAKILIEECGVKVRLGSANTAENNRIRNLDVMQKLVESKGKNLTEEHKTFATDLFYDAGVSLKLGEVDAVVAGAAAETRHVIRAALATVGLKPGVKVITGGFLMALREPTPGGTKVAIFADAAVIPQPTSEQLVDIAFLAQDAYHAWTNDDPHVAFLSFSTAGSADHTDVTKVKKAREEFNIRYPYISSEGDIQFDAATVPEVSLKKNPQSSVKGRANVMIFPDLDSGNIGYKIAQRLGGACAWGPVLFGSALPFSDLSRGATDIDIVHSAILTLALKK